MNNATNTIKLNGWINGNHESGFVYEPFAGSNIHRAILEAKLFTLHLEMPQITLLFNGIRLIVRNDSNIEDVTALYFALLKSSQA
jgi:hypothetical protein